ncbi:hypothetical protein KSS87_015596 [Heliosperma pusillum]|nr:hypothetical protein KSS87_015596 [Heliosperma pusillum]
MTTNTNDHLPLRLIQSETLPPSPTVSTTTGSTIADFLPDFAGYAWVAYAASSLLVISHFPSPLSPHQSHLHPLFRQVIPLSPPAAVSAVAWSAVVPSSGDLAAVVDHRVFLFRYDSSPGSFCWSQTAVLAQCAKVDAIAWTNSGDGIISAGAEVILWKRNIKSWEIAWKFKIKVPQTLVSTTWSIEGPSATGAYPTQLHDNGLGSITCNTSHCVTVYHYDGKSGCVSSELRHPQPVFAIQWRPSGGSQSNRAALYAPRHVMLTSCLDGTVRLWSEVDGNRIRKGAKDNQDASTSRRSFCVVGVIEINHSLNGTLGTDIFLTWALDIEGLVCVGDGQLFCTDKNQNDEVGRCEWLVGLGPGKMLTFWAVHCLDDIATIRSPRVTLWKRQELLESDIKKSYKSDHVNCTEGSRLNKAVIWRNQRCGPPALCAVVQLSACNSLAWSVLYNQSLVKMEENPSQICENKLYCQSGGVLDTIGHTGKLLQVAVHPFMCKVQLAVSLDSNGGLIFWSTTTSSYSISSLPSFTPSWQLIGKMTLHDNPSQEISLNWAPLCLGEDPILLVGHISGIDVHIVKISNTKGQATTCHKLSTIPFLGRDFLNGPDKIASFPLDSTCEDSYNFDNFLLLGIWMKSFQVESWKVALHCYESSGGSCQCKSDIDRDAECFTRVYKTDFDGKRYCLAVNHCSSYFPNGCDEVTSISVVSPSSVTSSLHKISDVESDLYPNKCSYHIITGHHDGKSRIWRIKMSEVSEVCMPFELVGMLSSVTGSVSAISAADWGQKIATICSNDQAYVLCIWEPQHLANGGTFVLEDKIDLIEEVIALHWLVIDNMLFLGVCFQNELHIYSRKVYSVLTPTETRNWVCVAIVRNSNTIRDFLLGPNGTIVVIHVNYFSLFIPWSFRMGNKHLSGSYVTLNSALSIQNEMDRDSPESCSRKFYLCEELPSENISDEGLIFPPLTRNSYCAVESESQPLITSYNSNHHLKMTEVAESICGPLPFYHPEALLMNIYSGNWKRANVAVSHLIECLASNSASERRVNLAKSSTAVSQVNLSNYFEGQMLSGRTSQVFQWSRDPSTTTWSSNSESGLMQFSAGDTTNMFTASVSSSKSPGFQEVLEKLWVHEVLTDSQKLKMFAIVDLLREINNSQYASAFESLDEPGRRFWCAIRLQQLESHIEYSRKPSVEELVIDSQLIGWAFQSDCHMNLFNTILPTEPTWVEMRKIGIGFWFTNLTDLRTKMEKLARCQYLRKKDPKDCALLYIALNRHQVLAGLFKISKDEKDKPLVAFLSRNFQEEKNKAAASKNAYVLMGRHQFGLAIAFFLLSGDIISAVTVCAKTLGDGQLALVICRLLEGLSGPSERHLISKILLPSAIEKEDYWLASVLEWMLGNYFQSVMTFVGLQGNSSDTEPEKSKHPAFLDPSIGQYCLLLATKNSLRNALGELNTAVLSQWAMAMIACAFKKCGLPLEALECLSTSTSTITVPNNGTVHEKYDILPRIFRPSPADSSRWLSNEVSYCLAYQSKLDLAMVYIAKLLREHPGWRDNSLDLTDARTCSLEHKMSQLGGLLESFEQKLDSSFAYLEQKFKLLRNTLLCKVCFVYVNPTEVIVSVGKNAITSNLFIFQVFVFLDNNGQLSIGYRLLQGSSQIHLPSLAHVVSSSSQLFNLLVKDAENLSCSLSRFVTTGSMASLHLLASPENTLFDKNPYYCFPYVEFYTKGFMSSMCSLTSALMMLCKDGSEDLTRQLIMTIDLCQYSLCFTSAILQRNDKALDALLQPIMASCSNGINREVEMANLKAKLGEVMEALNPKSSNVSTANKLVNQGVLHGDGGDKMITIPEDERFLILGASLWKHLSKFIKRQLGNLTSNSVTDMTQASSVYTESQDNGFLELDRRVMMIFIDVMENTLTHISFHAAMQLAVFFWHKTGSGNSVGTLMWLEEFSQSKLSVFAEQSGENSGYSKVTDENALLSSTEMLAKFCNDPKIISELLAQLPMKLSESIHLNPTRGWNHFHMGALQDHEKLESYKQEGIFDSSPRGGGSGDKSPSVSEQSHYLLDSDVKGAALTNEVAPFRSPREIHRRNGELLEALCINSIEQRRAAVASNKKGIVYFDLGDGLPSKASSNFVWEEADWPQKGWAGTKSTPVPTCVAPGVGLGSSKGSHLGLGGAIVGDGSQARLGKELTGGGAFGIPDYAGIGASGLGWGIQDDFDKSIDPPATLDNISVRALASHPSRPYFLAGSSNTHIYLWEFGEEKAVATYGVLPAANVPPPYALASVTALQFDCSGHRFTNCAADGTVCTWQLEVGGRSNVRPTDSFLCFNGHASDICYVATSGSIIASAGYSSNGVNVVIWDTLAPPTSSRASVMCHEGGACSISVFDNDVGTGSISPLIVTGGKGGDVGLHDFRYIATGKTKRHKHSNTLERATDTAAIDVQLSSNAGDQNRHGMLWDGDVKLWDAKKARLVYHWPKLHERHTFLQRSTQSFGGVTRVGLTDIQVISDGFLTCGGDGLVFGRVFEVLGRCLWRWVEFLMRIAGRVVVVDAGDDVLVMSSVQRRFSGSSGDSLWSWLAVVWVVVDG